ncbi:MAG: hypothetical protein KF900_14020 [Bacteroidetes bacterium]|nr:hypothetical protein [Bacteroidota bacterium]
MSNNSTYIAEGVGYTAKKMRVLKDASRFEKFFPKPTFTDPVTVNGIDTIETVSIAKKIVLQTLADTVKVAPTLKGKDLNETCRNVWNFFYNHYQYKIDKPGVEQLRRPARAFADRKSGVDCDCFAISVSSFLTNLGIRHYFRVVKMYGKDYYQHIYIIVPKTKTSNKNNRADYYVIDPVVENYNEEPQNITLKTDIEMSIPVQYLNGIGSNEAADDLNVNLLGTEFDHLGESLGEAEAVIDNIYPEFLGAMHKHLSRTAKKIRSNPRSISMLYKPRETVQAIEGLLGVWHDEEKRDAELDRLASIEETLMQPAFRGLGNALLSDTKFFETINSTDEELSGLGSAPTLGAIKILQKGKTVVKNTAAKAKEAAAKAAAATKAAAQKAAEAAKAAAAKTAAATKAAAEKAAEATKAAAQKAAAATKAAAQKAAEAAKAAAAKTAAAAKAAAQKTAEAAKNAAAKTKEVVQKAAAKTKEVAKKVGQAVVKYNPVSLAARGAVIVAMKVNFGRLASRAYWGYFSQAEAAKAGVTASYHSKAVQAKNKLEETFVQKMKGDAAALKKAIITGRAAKVVAKLAKGVKGLGALKNLLKNVFSKQQQAAPAPAAQKVVAAQAARVAPQAQKMAVLKSEINRPENAAAKQALVSQQALKRMTPHQHAVAKQLYKKGLPNRFTRTIKPLTQAQAEIAVTDVNGLGLDPATATLIAAGMAILVPMIALFAKLFKGKKGGDSEELPDGSEYSARGMDTENEDDIQPGDENKEYNPLDLLQTAMKTANDLVDLANKNKPKTPKSSSNNNPPPPPAPSQPQYTQPIDTYDNEVNNTPEPASTPTETEEKKGMSKGMIAGLAAAGLAVVGGIIYAVSRPKERAVNGTENNGVAGNKPTPKLKVVKI